MKRRQRKPVLNINGDSVADSHRRRWPNERNAGQTQNGLPSNNPLTNLVGHYNSDSEAEEDNRPRARVLNDKVDDFFKEIQSISHDGLKNKNMSHPGSYWQECFDEQTGYPYYWHTETNQVTWEIPAELKALHEKNEKETPAAPHASHIPQWPNAPPSKYPQSSQSNIPEGMIPKDVVVRNRNRQAGIVNKPAKSPKTDCFKVPFSKDDSFDDGKIEMITSFGNDESESEEESEQEEPQMQKSCLKKSSTKPGKSSSHSSESKEPRALMGPAPPPVAPLNYGPQNKEKLSDRLSQNVPRTKTQKKADVKDDDDILKRLKSQAKLLQTCENDEKSSSSREDRSHTPPKPPTSDLTDKSKKRIKLSLVPGYEDDSEGEDEPSSSRKSAKPLFPISEQLPPTDSQSDGIAKKIDTNVGSLRVYDYRNTDSTQSEPKIENASTDSQSNVEEKPEEGLESKANKFLDSIDVPSKAFQRKKRIAFDVAPIKSKEPEAKEEPSSSGPVQVSSTDPSERRGFGFSKDENRNSPEAESGKTESDAVPASKKPGIAFVKSTEESTSGNNVSNGSDNGANSTSKPKESSEAEKTEVKQLTEPIMEKLRFLSEGSSPASAVQIMAIQIQTLMCAWEAGVLQEEYLRNWLVGTASELTRLEQTAAPPGWECQWDRSHKRYYYRNVSTGEAQWTYPVTDIAGGTEEMDLCTTPPPPEHEETPIIEMSAQAATMTTSSGKNQQETKPQPPPEPSNPIPPPPPPKISSPSPPPPPRIFAEDLKQGKKRKNSPERSEHEDSKDPKMGLEPLPPGVDSPEVAYTLPASALEAGVLYGAQQTNPIYAATLAGAAAAAGIPLLQHHHHHHHTALMQGQLVHYNSAYHQHLHNQALVAARLTGQEAVQFMVAAEYARVYENNQVIAKPPVKMTQESSMGSALNSFYSDIASIEHTAETERERIEAIANVPSPVPQVPHTEVDAVLLEAMKEKKKKKMKTGIGKKQKEMSSMVAKWQRAQKNYKD